MVHSIKGGALSGTCYKVDAISGAQLCYIMFRTGHNDMHFGFELVEYI